MSKFRKTGTLLLTAVMALSAFSTVGTTKVQAADFSGQLKSADNVTIDYRKDHFPGGWHLPLQCGSGSGIQRLPDSARRLFGYR